MRKLVLALVLLIAVGFVISHYSSFEKFISVLQHGRPEWIGLAVAVQAAWLLNQAAQYQAVFRALNVERPMKTLVPLVLASNFLNVVAPSAGLSGIAVFVDDARRRKLSTARVTLAGALYTLIDYIAFCIVLALGLIVLFRRNNLSAIEIIPSAIMFCAVIVLSAIVALGMRSSAALERVLVAGARAVNWVVRPIIQRGYLSESLAHEFAVDAAEGLRTLRQQPPKYWIVPVVLALSSRALMITLLLLIFLAFEQPFSIGTLTAGFSIGVLFQIVSPTPMGIGVVEAAMTLTLSSLTVPLEAAFFITIVFRGFTLWLPLLYGFLALQLTGLQRQPG
jgi:glycosyltransferase 2 family protein